jgi:hypothetical protein
LPLNYTIIIRVTLLILHVINFQTPYVDGYGVQAWFKDIKE